MTKLPHINTEHPGENLVRKKPWPDPQLKGPSQLPGVFQKERVLVSEDKRPSFITISF